MGWGALSTALRTSSDWSIVERLRFGKILVFRDRAVLYKPRIAPKAEKGLGKTVCLQA